MSGHARVLPDEYVPPRYPVDEPPTYRQRCACGWAGQERYRGIDVGDHAAHVRLESITEAGYGAFVANPDGVARGEAPIAGEQP